MQKSFECVLKFIKEIPDDDLFIADQQLAVVDKVKLLGVIIRDDLKWDGQVENIKANQKFFMLRKLKKAGFSSQELVTIYKGYMRPVLEYAAPLWHPGLTKKQVDLAWWRASRNVSVGIS